MSNWIEDYHKRRLFSGTYLTLLNNPGHPSWHRLKKEENITDYWKGVFDGRIGTFNCVLFYLELEEEFSKYLNESKDPHLLSLIVSNRTEKPNLETVKHQLLSLVHKAGISSEEFINYIKQMEQSK